MNQLKKTTEIVKLLSYLYTLLISGRILNVNKNIIKLLSVNM